MGKNSNGNRILQIIYRWKALIKEKSERQLVLKMIHCASLASREKKIGCEDELAGSERDEANWPFRRLQVGPMMQLEPLLA
jgi:hypothetical protein